MPDDRFDTTRRNVLQGVAGVAGAVSLAGCTGLLPGSGDGSSVRYAQVLPPVTLDPVRIDDAPSAQVAGRVFEGLYAFGSGTDVVPQLAAGRPDRDGPGTTYTVELREAATFGNGDAVTAEDVRYSFETPLAEDATPKWALDPIEEIRTPEERTVEFHLEHPYPPFVHALTRPILSKDVRSADPEKFGSDPVGSGPFEVERFNPGRSAILAARDDYWGGATPAVDRVKFVGNHSGLARSTSLRTGQNDVVERVQPKLWRVTEGMPDTRVRATRSLNYFYVGFNCNAGPTADPKVRKAVDYLVDLDELVEHFVDPTGGGGGGEDAGGTGSEGADGNGGGDGPPDRGGGASGDGSTWRQYGPLPEALAREWDLPVDRWREVPRRKNPEEARKLLGEADVGSWRPKVAVPNDMLREKFAEAVVHELSNLGYRRARTVKYPWSKFRERLRAGSPSDYHLFVGSWSGWPDPDAFLYPLFHENNEGVTNFTFYQNEEVMNAIRRARETTDRNARRRRYESAIETLLEDRVHLSAFTLHNSFGVKEYLEGFEPHPISSVNPRFVGPDGTVSLSK